MDTQSPHNLPEQPNPLLGREQELEAAREQLLIDEVRLLSLTGPPGVGKSRLAIAVAESVLENFPEGVWFIDLAPLRDPVLVGSQIANIFGIAEVRTDTALNTLVAYLRDRQVLLLLDNFEGVLTAAAWVGNLLEQTSGLKVLTTSRERLRLRWERTILIPPLALPDLDLPLDLSKLEGIPSVSLFLRRAKAVNASFDLTLENAHIITTLCTRLDGLPLAIELAAARAGVLSPAEILANMDDRFHLLGVGARDLPERHQTLKAAIDWSYESLMPEEGQFLRRLSVFTGGFSLAAAEIVGECQSLGLDGLDSLIDLAEKSLIVRARSPVSESRFTFLESIRDYLLDRLRTSGGLEGARRRHAGYYIGLAERNFSEMKKGNRNSWLDVLESEHDNLRAVLQWSLETGEYSIGKRIAAALWSPFWWLHGHVREGLRWLEIFLRSDGETLDETYLRILEGIGTLRGWQRDFEQGKASLMEALQIAQEREDQIAVARTLSLLGWIMWMNGKTEETTWLAEKIEACPSDVNPWRLAYAYLSLGSLLYDAGFDDAAQEAYTKSLENFQFSEERSGSVFARIRLALLKHKKGDRQKATEEMVEALEAARQLNELHIIAYCVADAAQLAAHLMSEQNMSGEFGQEKLAQVLGAVDRWREMLSLLRTPHENSTHLQITESLRSQMGEGSYLRAWQAGQSMPVERVIEEATGILEASSSQLAKDQRLTESEEVSLALTERERQVIELVAEGLTNQEIGERLFITERTVRFHITSIFNKLGASNRAQAVAIANQLGLL
jgi:predicted ATPase/DNA-binding CsgD family transcriptional regulator